ncbi:aminopeptidase Ey-like [Clarias gariepinus]|uniref:aminopeptidase Ey-like n=1 Tax=Clarias gariepinus TaxID=13013 RepID=UPI00234CFE5A|nr:aminopeptidase Ey-like [Clarias gariepinus]
MPKCPFSTMCIICTVVSFISVSILVGLWTYQFYTFFNQKGSQIAALRGSRLTECLRPVSYDVTLWPRLKENIFMGNSSAVFQCVKETDLILLHANKLNLSTEATLSALSGAPAPAIVRIQTLSRSQCLVLHLSETLKAGERYTLHISFTGELADDLEGFYRSEDEESGVKSSLTSARLRPSHPAAQLRPSHPAAQLRPSHPVGVSSSLAETSSNTLPVLHITLLKECSSFTFTGEHTVKT